MELTNRMALSSPQPRTSGKAVPGGPIPASLPDGTARYAAPALAITAHKRGGRRAAPEPARSTGQLTRPPCFAARPQRLRYITSPAPDGFTGIGGWEWGENRK